MDKIEFQKGTVLLQEGEISNRLMIVLSGTVEIYKGDVLIDTLEEKDGVYGEMSVLLQQPHTATVKAASTVSAIVVDDAEGYLKSRPDACFRIMTSLAGRLNNITTELAAMRKDNAKSISAARVDKAVKGALRTRLRAVDLISDENYVVEVLDEVP